jgi:glycosyltransferase involved in cell wall biosynthesis
MTRPRVTVIVDTYNHERYIDKAVSSALEQDFPANATEVIVVDDGSTDATAQILRTYESRVRVIRKENGGQASAFNVAIAAAEGEIVAFLDGDDWWDRIKLSRIVAHFDSHPGIGVIGHGIFQVETAEEQILRTVPPCSGEIDFTTGKGAAYFREMMCFFGTSRLAIRSEIAKRVIPIPESIVIEADEYLAIMSILSSRAALLEEPLTYYRLHSENLYQTRSNDPQKVRRLYQSIAALADALATQLTGAAVGQDQIRWLVRPLELQATKLRLNLLGGMPWETFKVERDERNVNYSKRSLSYRMFEVFSLGLTLVMPPRRYYQLRRWYGNSRLRQARRLLGEPIPSSRVSSSLDEGVQTADKTSDGQ